MGSNEVSLIPPGDCRAQGRDRASREFATTEQYLGLRNLLKRRETA